MLPSRFRLPIRDVTRSVSLDKCLLISQNVVKADRLVSTPVDNKHVPINHLEMGERIHEKMKRAPHVNWNMLMAQIDL